MGRLKSMTSTNHHGFNKQYMGVSKHRVTPKSSIFVWFSIINHLFWEFSPYSWKHPIYLLRHRMTIQKVQPTRDVDVFQGGSKDGCGTWIPFFPWGGPRGVSQAPLGPVKQQKYIGDSFNHVTFSSSIFFCIH